MNYIHERQDDILSVIRGLDISPTLYKNAEEKYHALGTFLNDYGVDAEIYPQGSFALGTVVRPSTNDSAGCYDLDFICQVTGSRDEHSPIGLRTQVEKALTSDKTYADRLTIDDKCFTIEYADVNGIGFSIDIVPATDESEKNKQMLSLKSRSPDLIETSISIPKRENNNTFQWITNNPKGFRKWFEDINAPFLASVKEAEQLRLLTESRSVYASVEDIPHELHRSALQRVIQILKCHRNNYYAPIADGDDIKPISAIITVTAARIAEHYNPNCTVFELLNHVLSELSIYSEYQHITEKDFALKFGSRVVLSRRSGKWFIENPANPDDNLADQWNNNARIPAKFFDWVKVAQNDLIISLEQKDDKQFRAILENSFGGKTVSGFLGNKYGGDAAPRQIISKTAPKPFLV